MNNYRDLNKELVEQVQTMRKNMKAYCDEIIYLKKELLEKHESELFLRKQCYNWAVNNFLSVIQIVEPDSDILRILQDHRKIVSSYSTGNRDSRSRSSGDVRRRSSALTMELQRSNSIIRMRKSVCSISPIKGKSNPMGKDDEEKEPNAQYVQKEIDLNQDGEAAGNELQISDIHEVIYEESEEDEVEEVTDLEIESLYESVKDVSDNVPTSNVLKDVTNTPINKIESTEVRNIESKNIHQEGRLKAKIKNISMLDNTTDEIDKDREINSKTKHRIKVMVENSEETFQVPRQQSSTSLISEASKSIPIHQYLQEEASLHSPPPFIDMTGDIVNAACSTPNTRKNSLRKSKNTYVSNNSETIMGSSVYSDNNSTKVRPSRQCKPKNLTEQTLRKKLRNESEVKHKCKSKTKKK